MVVVSGGMDPATGAWDVTIFRAIKATDELDVTIKLGDTNKNTLSIALGVS